MKGLPESPATYFTSSIQPLSPSGHSIHGQQMFGAEYLAKLRGLFGDLDTELAHRGSTAFGIAGKGDVEIGVYPADEAWAEVLERLRGLLWAGGERRGELCAVQRCGW